MVVLALFAVLGFAGIRIAQGCPDRFSQLAAAGVTAWLLGQGLVNMGAVVGLLPITGIPLPMVSFGGSALVPTLFALGMLASFARRRAVGGEGPRRPPQEPPRPAARVPGRLTVRVLLAGGGTAGHVEPALATADALRRLDPDCELALLGTERGPGDEAGARPRLPSWS